MLSIFLVPGGLALFVAIVGIVAVIAEHRRAPRQYQSSGNRRAASR
jgi:hypothetical protein